MNTYETIQQRVNTLAAEFPALGLTFGYIGNVSRFGDDRGWRVFTKVRTAEGRSVSWGDWSSNDLPTMQAAIDSGRLRLFCESAVKKYTTPAPAPARVYDDCLARSLEASDFQRTAPYGNSARDARRDAENRAAEELADPPATSDAEWRALMAAALDKPVLKDDDDIPF